jgi:hypothetical protein
MMGGRAALDAEQGAWSELLRELFHSLAIPQGPTTEHLTVSVARYCAQYCPAGVQRSDLVLLLARAFCAISDRASAARVLRSVKPHARHVDRWLEILSELHHVPTLLPYFSSGMIRPADWAGARLDRMWTLDLGRMALAESERHEMMLYQSLRAIVANMAPFWDATQGEGVLGLKGLDAFRLEPDAGDVPSCTAAEALMEYVAQLLLQQKGARRWRAVPALMNLDL